MASFIPYVVALILALNVAEGLRCYSCNSKDSFACSYGLASFTYNTEECSGDAGFLNSLVGPKCFKITAKNREGNQYIARGCLNGPAVACKALAQTVGWVSGASTNDQDTISEMNCETCETDKCNSASKVAGFTLLGLVLATFAFLF